MSRRDCKNSNLPACKMGKIEDTKSFDKKKIKLLNYWVLRRQWTSRICCSLGLRVASGWRRRVQSRHCIGAVGLKSDFYYCCCCRPCTPRVSDSVFRSKHEFIDRSYRSSSLVASNLPPRFLAFFLHTFLELFFLTKMPSILAGWDVKQSIRTRVSYVLWDFEFFCQG